MVAIITVFRVTIIVWTSVTVHYCFGICFIQGTVEPTDEFEIDTALLWVRVSSCEWSYCFS